MDDYAAPVHLCIARYTQAKYTIAPCPTCKTRRKMAAFFAEWYGWETTCLTCGDEWLDGEMLGRPFERGWRARSVAQAKAMMGRLAKLPRDAARSGGTKRT